MKEHCLEAQLSRIVSTLQDWQYVFDTTDRPITAERLARWKIGIEADLTEATKHIMAHIEKLESRY